MQRELCKTKNTDKTKDVVNVIKSGLSDLQGDIKEMSKCEKRIEQPDKIVDIAERILRLIDKTKKDKD